VIGRAAALVAASNEHDGIIFTPTSAKTSGLISLPLALKIGRLFAQPVEAIFFLDEEHRDVA